MHLLRVNVSNLRHKVNPILPVPGTLCPKPVWGIGCYSPMQVYPEWPRYK